MALFRINSARNYIHHRIYILHAHTKCMFLIRLEFKTANSNFKLNLQKKIHTTCEKYSQKDYSTLKTLKKQIYTIKL